MILSTSGLERHRFQVWQRRMQWFRRWMTYCASDLYMALKSIPWPPLCAVYWGAHFWGALVSWLPGRLCHWVALVENGTLEEGRDQGLSPLLFCFRQYLWQWLRLLWSGSKSFPDRPHLWCNLPHGSPAMVLLCFLAFKHHLPPGPSKPSVTSGFLLLLLLGCLILSCLP